MQNVLKIQYISLLHKHKKCASRVVFLPVFVYMNAYL